MNLACRSCGSKRLLRGIRVVGGFLNRNPVNVAIPSASGLGKSVRSSVSADVCVDCGHLDLHAVDLTELRRLYASIGEPLSLGSRDPVGSSEGSS
jgi:hypothetical protein